MVRLPISIRGARLLTAVLALGALSACSSAIQSGGAAVAQVGAPLIAVDMASVVMTDKTVVDHVAGLSSGQDCSTLRAQNGGHYCTEPYENEPVVQNLYCYRTLAAVSCYDRPSPNPADHLVGMRAGARLQTY